MTISSVSGNLPQGAVVTGAAKQDSAAPASDVKVIDAKMQLNISIVQASFEVSIKTQNESMALLYRSAIANLNEALQPEFGEDAIQNAVAQDNTPKGTADRIVALSTAFYDGFKQQHPDEEDTAVFDKFMETIRRGMEKGFAEARDILQGLGVLGGDIATNIDKTYELVQKGYADFETAHKAPQTEETSN